MSEQSHQSLLRNFFSGYFHEDWPCEAESPSAVVDLYLRTAAPSDVRALSEALREYSQRFASDGELEQNLFTEMGCYYRPSIEGISAKAWLENMADQVSRQTRGVDIHDRTRTRRP